MDGIRWTDSDLAEDQKAFLVALGTKSLKHDLDDLDCRISAIDATIRELASGGSRLAAPYAGRHYEDVAPELLDWEMSLDHGDLP
jgi:hypothetical protein